jgi:hypothetical protein
MIPKDTPLPNTGQQSTNEEFDLSQRILRDLLKNAINDAQLAYKNLRTLSNVTFYSGLILIIFAAVTGVVLQKETYSLIFGGAGTAFVLAFFFMKPKEEIQTALSNLLQAEIIFLDFYDQMNLWAPCIQKAKSIADRQTASAELHKVATNAVELLQKYLEPNDKSSAVKPSINSPSELIHQ